MARTVSNIDTRLYQAMASAWVDEYLATRQSRHSYVYGIQHAFYSGYALARERLETASRGARRCKRARGTSLVKALDRWLEILRSDALRLHRYIDILQHSFLQGARHCYEPT